MSVKELKIFTGTLMEYCKNTIGYKKYKGLPSVSIRKHPSSDNQLGEYDPNVHKITLFYNNIKTMNGLVTVFVHEYTHSVQNLRYYAARFKKFGYSNHPDEIEARENEKKFGKSAFKHLKKHIKNG